MEVRQIESKHPFTLRIDHRDLPVTIDDQHAARHRVHDLLQSQPHTLVFCKAGVQCCVPFSQLQTEPVHFPLQLAVGILQSRGRRDELRERIGEKHGAASCLHLRFVLQRVLQIAVPIY